MCDVGSGIGRPRATPAGAAFFAMEDSRRLRRMGREGWQFDAPPFAGGIDPAAFHQSGPHEEALARLEWLVAERHRLALVTGTPGLGKSHLLAMLPRRLGGLGCEVALLSLGGLSDDDWLDLLLGRLPLDPPARAETQRPWQKLEDRLRENCLLERTTVIACDDGDRAPAAALAGLARLVTSPEPLFGRVLVVLAVTPPGVARLPDVLRGRAAVRVDLHAWDEADVGAFIAGALARVGGDPRLFTSSAVATITRFTGGVPGIVRRLATLALVAAEGEGAASIDAAIVERTWRELLPDDPVPGRVADDSDADDGPPSPPVRVVRRLDG